MLKPMYHSSQTAYLALYAKEKRRKNMPPLAEKNIKKQTIYLLLMFLLMLHCFNTGEYYLSGYNHESSFLFFTADTF